MVKKVKLRTGMEVEFDKKVPKTLFEILISDIFIPRYRETDDFNLAINVVLNEMNRLIKEYDLTPKLKLGLLDEIEYHLDKDLEELSGVAKIEILFLNMEDYIQDVKKLIVGGKGKVELRKDMANLIAPLTLFELGELFIFLGKKAFLE